MIHITNIGNFILVFIVVHGLLHTSAKTNIFVTMQEEPVVNPWLGDQILRLCSANADSQLREMFRAAREWMDRYDSFPE